MTGTSGVSLCDKLKSWPKFSCNGEMTAALSGAQSYSPVLYSGDRHLSPLLVEA